MYRSRFRTQLVAASTRPTDLHVLPDARAREGLQVQPISVAQSSHRALASAGSHRAPDQDLVPEPEDEGETRDTDDQGTERFAAEDTSSPYDVDHVRRLAAPTIANRTSSTLRSVRPATSATLLSARRRCAARVRSRRSQPKRARFISNLFDDTRVDLIRPRRVRSHRYHGRQRRIIAMQPINEVAAAASKTSPRVLRGSSRTSARSPLVFSSPSPGGNTGPRQ